MDFWAEVSALEGKELQTLHAKRKFKVLAVTNTLVVLHVQRTDKERNVQRDEIEIPYQELVTKGQLSRGAMYGPHESRNTAYVAAILAALPNCRFTLDPIIIWYSHKLSDNI